MQHASQTGHARAPNARARKPIAAPAGVGGGAVLFRAANVVALQRAVGNQAVVGMIPTPDLPAPRGGPGSGPTMHLVGWHAPARPTPPAPAIARAAPIQRQVTYTPGAPGTFSAVNLAAEQGGDGDGHTIDRHVTISDAALQARLADPAIPAATRWESQAAAEARVDAALAANAPDVSNWLDGGRDARAAAVANRALVANQLPNVTAPLWQAAATAARNASALAPAVFGPQQAPIAAALGRIRGATNAAPAATLQQRAAQAGVAIEGATAAQAGLVTLGNLHAAIPALPEIVAITAAVGAILAAATNWQAALQTARAQLTLEVRHDVAIANVSAAFRAPAGVQVTTAPRVMVYLHYVDATHFQIKTAFPGDPVNAAAALAVPAIPVVGAVAGGGP
jgi:hypothetical protein